MDEVALDAAIGLGIFAHEYLSPDAWCECTEQDFAPLVNLRRDFPHLTAHVHQCRCVENAAVPESDTSDKCHGHVCRDWKISCSEWIRASGEMWRLGKPVWDVVHPSPDDLARSRYSVFRGPVVIEVPELHVYEFDERNTGTFTVPYYLMQWLGGADECTAVRVLSQSRDDTAQPDWSTLPNDVKSEIMFHVRARPPAHREENPFKRHRMHEESTNPKRAKTDPAVRVWLENEGRTS